MELIKDSNWKWYYILCKVSVKKEKLQKAVKERVQLLTDSKKHTGRQDIFYFSKLSLIASTGCTLCAEHFYQRQPRTLGNSCCHSFTCREISPNQPLNWWELIMLQSLKKYLKQILYLSAIMLLKSSDKPNHRRAIAKTRSDQPWLCLAGSWKSPKAFNKPPGMEILQPLWLLSCAPRRDVF